MPDPRITPRSRLYRLVDSSLAFAAPGSLYLFDAPDRGEVLISRDGPIWMIVRRDIEPTRNSCEFEATEYGPRGSGNDPMRTFLFASEHGMVAWLRERFRETHGTATAL